MKVVARIRGGLGNQLFCYAAARRLALTNNAELVLDNVSGFSYDREFQRQFMLNYFDIPCRLASPSERMEPFSRYRRAIARGLSKRLPFALRTYVEEEGEVFNAKMLELEPHGDIYLDGLWQDEAYFKDIETVIRNDLRLIPLSDPINKDMVEKIRNSKSIAIHVRWFEAPGCSTINNISMDYYRRAIDYMNRRIDCPKYFLFSDNVEAARLKVGLGAEQVTLVNHNRGIRSSYDDLALMRQCRHFITANSTFSWWGAWLGQHEDKIVSCPGPQRVENRAAPWNLAGQLPMGWIRC